MAKSKFKFVSSTAIPTRLPQMVLKTIKALDLIEEGTLIDTRELCDRIGGAYMSSIHEHSAHPALAKYRTIKGTTKLWWGLPKTIIEYNKAHANGEL